MVHNLPVLQERDEAHDFKPADHLPSGKIFGLLSVGLVLLWLGGFTALVLLKIILLMPYWLGLGGAGLVLGGAIFTGFYILGRRAKKAQKDA
jgi:hypothetical protein